MGAGVALDDLALVGFRGDLGDVEDGLGCNLGDRSGRVVATEAVREAVAVAAG